VVVINPCDKFRDKIGLVYFMCSFVPIKFERVLSNHSRDISRYVVANNYVKVTYSTYSATYCGIPCHGSVGFRAHCIDLRDLKEYG
jgi:hypothetical protein